MDEAFFRKAYEADAANRTKQSWDDYWGWVQAFYKGKTFPPVPGWAKREEEIIRHHHVRHDVRHALSETGRLLAAEWSKDNSVRKVSTGDLQTWGKQFSDVSKDPVALLAALERVQAELRSRTGA